MSVTGAMSFKDRVVVVTGAGAGLGRSHALGTYKVTKAAWDTISDFDGATKPNSLADTLSPVFGNLGIAL